MIVLFGIAILLVLGYNALPKTAASGCAGYPAKFTNIGDNKTQCIAGAAPNPPGFANPPSKPVSIFTGATPKGTQSPAQNSSEPLSDLAMAHCGELNCDVHIWSADRSVNTAALNPNMVDGLPFNPITGRAAGNTLAPQPIMYSAPTELESPAGSDLSSTGVDYSD